MTCYDVQLNQLESVPLAVVRRQANARDLARVVPECCGLVWNVVRAQKTEAGRHVAIYWDLLSGLNRLGSAVHKRMSRVSGQDASPSNRIRGRVARHRRRLVV